VITHTDCMMMSDITNPDLQGHKVVTSLRRGASCREFLGVYLLLSLLVKVFTNLGW